MARTEIQNLKAAAAAPSINGKLTRLRMLLVAVEDDQTLLSKRLVIGLRKQFNKIIKTEGADNDQIATASRLLIRLDRIDPLKRQNRAKKNQIELETAAKPQFPAPTPPTPGGVDIWDLV